MLDPTVPRFGVSSLLASAEERPDETVKFFLAGDLLQMAAQEEALFACGLRLGRVDVYPGLRSEQDFRSALRIIWEHALPGWHHYRAECIRHGICSEIEFDARRRTAA